MLWFAKTRETHDLCAPLWSSGGGGEGGAAAAEDGGGADEGAAARRRGGKPLKRFLIGVADAQERDEWVGVIRNNANIGRNGKSAAPSATIGRGF